MTHIMHIQSKADVQNTVKLATETLMSGGVVLYPTDTTYALAVNALDTDAIDRVFQIKGRDYSKPIHVVVRDLNHASRFVVVSDSARQIANHFLPGALTLVLPQRPDSTIPPLLVAGEHTLGIRIPDHPICNALAQAVDFPITTTSANLSGLPNTYSVEVVSRQFGADFDKIDLAIDTGELPQGRVSTVIAVDGDSTRLIREGVIPFKGITEFLNKPSRKA
jgi:L-threonylcarbamoyladenylate synthase